MFGAVLLAMAVGATVCNVLWNGLGNDSFCTVQCFIGLCAMSLNPCIGHCLDIPVLHWSLHCCIAACCMHVLAFALAFAAFKALKLGWPC
jgi:hypothetical protein